MTSARPVYVVTLRPEPGIDPVRALKALLKVALRAFGLRCIAITEEQPPPRKELVK